MSILIVDDEPRFAEVLRRVLVADGFADVTVAHDAEEALANRTSPTLVITDLRLPGASGIELMRALRSRDPGVACILMTAFADVATAREALTSGAIDYLVKPFDNGELVALARRVAMRAAGAETALPGLIGASPAMRRVTAELRQAAESDSTVLLLGESGTGKELAAQALHHFSPRAKKRLVDVHLAALAESTLESELFGHERGAFTGAEARKPGFFELADGGTLFFDEIGELPLHIQPKILRALQERKVWRVGGTAALPVDVRIVAATNRDLAAEVKAGRFRADLFYRLDVLTITLPPLRERDDDVLLIANQLIAKHRPGACLTAEAVACLRRHRWPGNVRELANAMERACLVADSGRIDAVHLPERIRSGEAPATVAADTLDHTEHERILIRDALARADGNKSRAAELLGITRRRLYSRLKILGMDDGEVMED